MNFSAYFLYCLAVIVMIATPGPVMLLVASAGLKGGYKNALKTIFGTNFASLVLILLSVLILKGFIELNQSWFNAIKIAGCVYIAYLGLQIFRESLQADTENQSIQAVNGGFKQGFFVAIANPKDIIFFAAFFPQFINVTSDLNHSLSLLTLTWIILDFATLSLVYLLFNQLAKSKFYSKMLSICGAILIIVACYGVYSTLMS
ncbi:LysE family translocator [Acinetobacter gerneri]|uniref:LysE family translocator n=1 Tax=Acinetobacter gerneri TaxID=202952 RepID=UPI0023F09911|nr:LysE family translocator [Acinetobacter gerneri]MCH4245467.1 LysE family translocator [Acinetobacter gerneri]